MERLCEPPIQRLLARKWNFASSGWSLIRSSVANIFSVSTPLRIVCVTAVTWGPPGSFVGLVRDAGMTKPRGARAGQLEAPAWRRNGCSVPAAGAGHPRAGGCVAPRMRHYRATSGRLLLPEVVVGGVGNLDNLADRLGVALAGRRRDTAIGRQALDVRRAGKAVAVGAGRG